MKLRVSLEGHSVSRACTIQVLGEGDRVAVVGDGKLCDNISSLPGHAISRACAIQVLSKGDRVAVVGDGKLGLLVAQMLVLQRHSVTHFGKHEHKLRLVSGTHRELVTDQTAERHAAVSALRPCMVDSRVAQPPPTDSTREAFALAL